MPVYSEGEMYFKTWYEVYLCKKRWSSPYKGPWRPREGVYVYLLYYVCIAVLTLDGGLLVRSQYPEGPATDHLETGFSWFPCVYKRMLRWFPSFQVATTW